MNPARKGGIGNVKENRRARRGIFAPGVQARAARLVCHNRWHRDRKVFNPACFLCRKSKGHYDR